MLFNGNSEKLKLKVFGEKLNNYDFISFFIKNVGNVKISDIS